MLLVAMRMRAFWHAYGNRLVLPAAAITTFLLVWLFGRMWLYDRQCEREIAAAPGSAVIQNGTKAEIISQFLDIYDLDLTPPKAHAPPPTAKHPGELAEDWMNCRQVHPDNSPELGSVLKWLSTARIEQCLSNVNGRAFLTKSTGQTAKFQLVLEGGYKALFKVKRFERDDVVKLSDTRDRNRKERHNAEIASYHLQRLLGYNRVPIAVGRRVNFTSEMLPVADARIRENLVMRGTDVCIRQVGWVPRVSEQRLESMLCAEGGIFEGAVIMWLPRKVYASGINLWPNKPEPGEEWPSGIIHIDPEHPLLYNNLAKLLDFADSLIFDYLIQNVDRNAFYFEPAFESSIFMLDEGKSFANPFTDVNDIIDGFSQICQIHQLTYSRLHLLRRGVLSTVLRKVLSRDPIAPLLWEPHYTALDRRLDHVITCLDSCIRRYGIERVVIIEESLNEYTFSHFTISYNYLLVRSALLGY